MITMSKTKTHINIIAAVLVISFIAGCSTSANANKGTAHTARTPITIAGNNDEQLENDIEGSFPNDERSSLSTDDIVDFESYSEYIAGVPFFESYYQLVFDFGALPGGISNVPVENALAMYNELKTVFDYIIMVSQRPLWHMGIYEGDTRFVHGYDLYQSVGTGTGYPNPLNRAVRDSDGNDDFITPIKSVILCENSYSRFDSRISVGRNLQMSDFTLTASDEPISVVLGSAYMGIYELGDVISLMYLYEVMDFEVVGFYEPDMHFSMGASALQYVDMDNSIIMPYFIPMYEPVGEDAVAQHGIHIAELTSGYIAITEPLEEVNDDTHARYAAQVEDIAERYDLSGMHIIPLWPVGFVFHS